MPKRSVSGTAPVFGASGWTGDRLATWQAAGLSAAAIATALGTGVGVLAALPVTAATVWALHRLHARAPRADGLPALVGSVLDGRAARAVGVVLVAAYVLIAVGSAQTVGVSVLLIDPDILQTPGATPWWALLSLAAVALAGVAVLRLSTRVLAGTAAVLAAVGLLVYFYLSLAIIARTATGTPAVDIASESYTTGVAVTATVLLLAPGTVGFEVPAAANRRLRSVGRPIGVAVAVLVICAVTYLVAGNVGTTGGFRLAPELGAVGVGMFGAAGRHWLQIATAAIGAAGLLALLWAATRTAGRSVVTVAAITGVLAVLVVAACFDVGGFAAKTAGVAGMLLLTVYCVVAEANSRLPNHQSPAWALRALVFAALALVVVVPLLAGGSVWPVAVTAVLIAAACGAGVARPARRAHPIR